MVKNKGNREHVIIEDIMYYGRSYDSQTEYWWYSCTDNSVVSIDFLRSSYGWETREALAEQSVFIPLFKTDMIQLEKTYMKSFEKGIIESIMEYEQVEYDVAFSIFIETPMERFLHWKEYEKKRLIYDAIVWCKRNGLSYRHKT